MDIILQFPLLLQSYTSDIGTAASEIDPTVSTVVILAAFAAMVAVLTAFIRIVKKNNSPFK